MRNDYIILGIFATIIVGGGLYLFARQKSTAAIKVKGTACPGVEPYALRCPLTCGFYYALAIGTSSHLVVY